MGISIQGRTGWASVPNAIGRSRLPHPTVHLLLNLLTHSEGFDASYSTLTKQTGMSRATISSALKNLQKLELVTVEKRAGKNGKFDSNNYIFHADRLWTLTPEFVDARLRGKVTGSGNELGTGSGTELGTGSGNEPAPVQELNYKKEQEEPSWKNDQPPLTPTGEDGASAAGAESAPAVEQFDEWWKHVDKKEAKGDARKAFKAALKKVDLPTLIAGIQRSQEHWKRLGRARDKTPHPATWLRAESWEDEYGPTPGGQGSAGRRLSPEEIFMNDLRANAHNPNTSGQSWLDINGYTPKGIAQ